MTISTKTMPSTPVPDNEDAPVFCTSYHSYREKGAVTTVRNQGYSSDCWAIAAVGHIEGQCWRITNNTSVPLSVQQVVDNEPNSVARKQQGGAGGFITDGYNYIRDCGGLMREEGYPYRAGQEIGQRPAVDSTQFHPNTRILNNADDNEAPMCYDMISENLKTFTSQ